MMYHSSVCFDPNIVHLLTKPSSEPNPRISTAPFNTAPPVSMGYITQLPPPLLPPPDHLAFDLKPLAGRGKHG